MTNTHEKDGLFLSRKELEATREAIHWAENEGQDSFDMRELLVRINRVLEE